MGTRPASAPLQTVREAVSVLFWFWVALGFVALLLTRGLGLLILPGGPLGYLMPLWQPPDELIRATAGLWLLAQLLLHAGFVATGEWRYMTAIVGIALVSLGGAVVVTV